MRYLLNLLLLVFCFNVSNIRTGYTNICIVNLYCGRVVLYLYQIFVMYVLKGVNHVIQHRVVLLLGQISPVSAATPAIFHAGAASPIIGMRHFVQARIDKTSLPPRM